MYQASERPCGSKRCRTNRSVSRKGIVAVLALVLLPVLLAFLAFSVDSGKLSLAKANLQNGVDAASLAAAQEIATAVAQVGENGGDIDGVTSYALAQARTVAAEVAAANGIQVDPQTDVVFGRSTFNESSGTSSIEWGGSGPFNVVKVTANRDNPDLSQPNSEVPMTFGGFVGIGSVPLTATAAAYIQTRDIVVTLDFSGSMAYDSQYKSTSLSRLGKEAIDDNMRDIFDALGPPNVASLPWEPTDLTVTKSGTRNNISATANVTFKQGTASVKCSKTIYKIKVYDTSGNRKTYRNIRAQTKTVSSPSSRPIAKVIVQAQSRSGPSMTCEDTVDSVINALGLNNVKYPYPSGSWSSFIEFCRDNSDLDRVGYEYKYGGKCFVSYILSKKKLHTQTPDLWKTPHYPFEAVKNGCSLFLGFLDNLGFADQVGIVSYDTKYRVEDYLAPDDDEDGAGADIRQNPITFEYAALDTIQRHRNAGYYASTTNIAGGIQESLDLIKNNSRANAYKTLVVMTDGNANVKPDKVSIPEDWDWADYTDYDGNGTADYSTSNSYKKAAFVIAMKGVKDGVTIHTISVGAGADREFMEALAFAGKGIYIDIPGGSTVAQMEEQLLGAFAKIGARVPPPKLINIDKFTGQ